VAAQLVASRRYSAPQIQLVSYYEDKNNRKNENKWDQMQLNHYIIHMYAKLSAPTVECSITSL
jgi:hypothetical protein